MIQIAVLGYGTVGSGVAEVFSQNVALIEKRLGEGLAIKYILDLRDFPGDPYGDRVVHDVEVILQDPDVGILCETMGGIEPALTFTRRALLAGKSVCTSNKELVATHGAELSALAAQNNCCYLFEASVGGGIPVIRSINSALTAERVEEISGILNGTTNYILTKMEKEGTEFETALQEAQRLGYAERNPVADIEGHDASRKIAILSSLMAEKTVDYRAIYTEGIAHITAIDFDYAKALQKTIKLLAVSRRKEEGYLAAVCPWLVALDNPLASVNDVYNAVFVRSNMLGDTMYYGKGAGKLPTASAVAADVIDCAKNQGRHIACGWEVENAKLLDFSGMQHRFFVRAAQSQENLVDQLFGQIEKIRLDAYPEEFGFLTGPMAEKEFDEKKNKLPGFIGRLRIKE